MARYGFFLRDRVPERLRGLSIELVEDLYDAASKYGQAFAGQPFRRLSSALPDGREIHLTVVVPTERSHLRNITVAAEPGQLNMYGADVLLIDERGAFMAVERSFSPLDIEAAIRQADDLMEEIGAFNRTTGERRQVFQDRLEESPLLSVDREFARPLTMLRVIAKNRTDDEVRRMFDRPDDVVVVENDGFHPMLMSQTGWKIMTDALHEVLPLYGLKTDKDIESLDETTARRLHREWQQAMLRRVQTN